MNLTSTGEIAATVAAGLDEMPDKIRRAFDDYVALGPKRTFAQLKRQYESERESDGTDVPTTRALTIGEWSKKYEWLRLAPLVWEQQGIAQRSAAAATVDHGSLLAADTLIKLLDATQAVVLRKDGNQRGSDVIEFVSDNKTRLEAAKTLLDRSGVTTSRVAISERMSQVNGDSARTLVQAIEVEGRSAEDLMRALRESLLVSNIDSRAKGG